MPFSNDKAEVKLEFVLDYKCKFSLKKKSTLYKCLSRGHINDVIFIFQKSFLIKSIGCVDNSCYVTIVK